MANGQFRAASISVNNKKVAEASGSTFDHSNGGQIVYGSDGVLGISDGIAESKVEWDTITPVAGHQIDFAGILTGRQYVKISIFVDGKINVIEGKIQSRNYTTDSHSGTTKGKFMFVGGEPQQT